jgi:ketosteroid isomerase-like protein
MTYVAHWSLMLIAATMLARAATDPASSAPALSDPKQEVAPLLTAMGAAANAHDVERHVGFYARDPAVTFIFNGKAIVGWTAIRDNQRDVWRNGKSDVTYTMQGKPQFSVLSADVVITTLFLHSRRTMPDGEIRDGDFAISSIWQRRQEGWRVVYAHESTTR